MELVEIHLKEKAQIGMTDTERSLMRSNIVSYMEANEALSQPYVQSPFMQFLRHPLVVTMCSFVFLIAGGAFASYQVSQSLPGDLLYPLKTRVTEKVAGELVTSPQAQLLLQQSFVTQRIQEIQALNKKGDLNAATATVAEQATASTVADFNATATSLAQNDPQTFEATKQALAPLIAKNEQDIIDVANTTSAAPIDTTTTPAPTSTGTSPSGTSATQVPATDTSTPSTQTSTTALVTPSAPTDTTIPATTSPNTAATSSTTQTPSIDTSTAAPSTTPNTSTTTSTATTGTAQTLQNILTNVQSQTATLNSLPASTAGTLPPNQPASPLPQESVTPAQPIQ